MPPTTKHLKPHQFKKGQSGNPQGGRLHNPIKRALKNLTQETFREVVELVLSGNLDSLRQMIEDPKTSALQVGVAMAFHKALKNGDYATVREIAAELVGKVPQELVVKSENKNLNLNGNVDPEIVKAAILKLESDV